MRTFLGKTDRGPAKTEIVTVRLEPKMRYLVMLAARVQRRTVSSFVENAVADFVEQLNNPPPGACPHCGRLP